MDHLVSSVLETLLKTNRPPTDEEKAIIQASMPPITKRLKAVQEEISDVTSHIQALQLQLEQAETKLQRLREKEAPILETYEDRRGVLSAVRNLPEDVLREILVACVKDHMPLLSDEIALPYVLAQISSGMRHIALTTPIIWTRMELPLYYMCDIPPGKHFFSNMARKARTWLGRAGGLPLTLFIADPTSPYRRLQYDNSESDPSDILLDTLLSYSANWKVIRFTSGENTSKPIRLIAALKAANVPLLESISLNLEHVDPLPFTSNNEFIKIPTLKHLSLKSHSLQSFQPNWSTLTSVSLIGKRGHLSYSRNELVIILQQIKHLIRCTIDIYLHSVDHELGIEEITLPFLEILHIDETRNGFSPEAHSLLDVITAPALEKFHIHKGFRKSSLLDFLQRSPRIWKLSLPCLINDMASVLCSLYYTFRRPVDSEEFNHRNQTLIPFAEHSSNKVILGMVLSVRICRISISPEISISLFKRCSYFSMASTGKPLRQTSYHGKR